MLEGQWFSKHSAHCTVFLAATNRGTLNFKAGNTTGEWDTRTFKIWRIIIFQILDNQNFMTHIV